jgi:hypothetical protein
MNLDRWLTAVFLILALAGCVQVAARQGQVPDAPYSHEMRDRGGDGGGSGGDM